MGVYLSFLSFPGVCVKEVATLLVGAQLLANRFRCRRITDNPARFESKSTQVTPALRPDEKRAESGGQKRGETRTKLARERAADGKETT